MEESRARGRRWLSLGLVALVAAGPAAAQSWPPPSRTGAHGQPRPEPVMVVHDGHGLVTIEGRQASVRELLRILSKWFELPAVNLESIPDNPRAIRFERVPVAQAVRELLASVGRGRMRVPDRPRRLAPVRSASFLTAVHDGRGAVTLSGEQVGTREVLALLSRWFDFPILNPETIPDVRRSVNFERAPVDQVVDDLLRATRVNYLIVADRTTQVPSKVLAAAAPPEAPASVDPREGGMPPGWRAGGPTVARPQWPGAFGNPAMPMPVDPAALLMPMDASAPVPIPVDPNTGMPQGIATTSPNPYTTVNGVPTATVSPPNGTGAATQPPPAGSPAWAPGVTRPGQVTPGPAQTTVIKPPG